MRRRHIIIGALALTASGALVVVAAGAELGLTGSGPKPLPKPRSNFSVSEARTFQRYPLYFAGEFAAGYPLVGIHRVQAERDPQTGFRQDSVTFLYGVCQANIGDGCMPPLQVQVWNACERYPGMYGIAPDESLVVRGVPAAFYEGRTRLELYSGSATIVVFGSDREQLLEVADRLRGLNLQVAEGVSFPPPLPGAREGTLECQMR